jgi:hypothetical protein
MTGIERDTPESTAQLGRAFVVGCRRSGTTWTMMLVAQHPEAVALQQTDVMRRLFHFTTWFEQDHPYGRCILTPDESWASRRAANGLARIGLSETIEPDRLYALVRPLADEIFARAAATNPRTRLVVEQTPEHIHAAERILRVYPDARFVNVIRDPRAVFSSHRGSDRGWAKPSFFSSDPIDVSREWSRAVHEGQAIAELTDRYLELRYEALIEDGVGELKRLYSFLGLSSDEELCRHALEACGIERMRQADHAPRGFFRKGQAESWKEELDVGELRAIEYVCGNTMVELGYPLTQEHPVSAPLRLKVRSLRGGFRDRLRQAGQGDGLTGRLLQSAARFAPPLRRAIAAPGRRTP